MEKFAQRLTQLPQDTNTSITRSLSDIKKCANELKSHGDTTAATKLINKMSSELIETMDRVEGLQKQGYKTLAEIQGEIATKKINPENGSIKCMDAIGKNTGITRFVKLANGKQVEIRKWDNELIVNPSIVDGDTLYSVMKHLGSNNNGKRMLLKDLLNHKTHKQIIYGIKKDIPENIANRMIDSGNVIGDSVCEEFYKDNHNTLKDAVEAMIK